MKKTKSLFINKALVLIMALSMIVGVSAMGADDSHAATEYTGNVVSELTDGDYIIVGEAGSDWSAAGKGWFALASQVAGNSGSGYGLTGEKLSGFDKSSATSTQSDTLWTYSSADKSFKNKETGKYLNMPSGSFSPDYLSDTPVALTHYNIGNGEGIVYVPNGNGGYYLGTSSSTDKPFGSKNAKYINSSWITAGSGVYFCKVEVEGEDPLLSAKESAKEELNTYRASKDDSLYAEAQIKELNDAVTAGAAAIDAATTQEDVATALSDAKATIDAVKTQDQMEAAELEELRSKLAAAEKELGDTKTELEKATANNEQLAKDKEQLAKDKEQLNKDLAATKDELNNTKAELAAANEKLSGTSAALKNTAEELSKLKAELAASKTSAAAAKATSAAKSRTISGLTVKAQKGRTILATWKKTAGASGYEIWRAEGANKGYKKITIINKQSTVKFTGGKLKANSLQYYKMRPFTNVKQNGKTVKVYGKWTAVKTVRVSAK